MCNVGLNLAIFSLFNNAPRDRNLLWFCIETPIQAITPGINEMKLQRRGASSAPGDP
jgi:hypothetical protein